MDIYYEHFSADEDTGGSLLSFLDSVAALDYMGFTELAILGLAADLEMRPNVRYYHWNGKALPPFTVQRYDIGRVICFSQNMSTWDLFEDRHILDDEVRYGLDSLYEL
jgi:hypothetical protein